MRRYLFLLALLALVLSSKARADIQVFDCGGNIKAAHTISEDLVDSMQLNFEQVNGPFEITLAHHEGRKQLTTDSPKVTINNPGAGPFPK